MASQDDLTLLKQMHRRGEISDEQYDVLRRHVLWGAPLPQLMDEVPPASPAPGRPRVADRYATPAGYVPDDPPTAPWRPETGFVAVPERPAGPPRGRRPGPDRGLADYDPGTGQRAAPPPYRPGGEPAAPARVPPSYRPEGEPDPAYRRQGEPTEDRGATAYERGSRNPGRAGSAYRPQGEPAPPGVPPGPARTATAHRPAGAAARRLEAPREPEPAGRRARRPGADPPERGARRPGADPPERGARRPGADPPERGARRPGADPPERGARRPGADPPERPERPQRTRGRRARGIAAALTSLLLALALTAAGVWWFVFRETGVEAPAYARSICESVRDWQRQVDASSSALVKSIPREKDRARIRSAVEKYFTDLATRTDGLRAAIDLAGPVDVPGGRAYADSLAAAVSDQSGALRDLAVRTARLDATAATTFQVSLQSLLTGAETAVSDVIAALARPAAGTPAPLRLALSDEPACAPYVG